MAVRQVWVKLKCCFNDCCGKNTTFEIPYSDYKANKKVSCPRSHYMPAQSFNFVKKVN